MIILGIDPGYAIVGWGVIEYNNTKFKTIAYGAVTTPAGMDFSERLERIYDEISLIIAKYKPEAVAVEELFFGHNHTTMVPVAEARGVILLCAHQNGLRIGEYTPSQVKQSVVGYGSAIKKQVMSMVAMLLNLKDAPKLDDTCDALAIAICHANQSTSRMRGFFNQDYYKYRTR